MLDTLLNHLATAAIGLAILGGAYFVDLLVGSIKVLFTNNIKWSWKKAGEDFLKALILAVGVEIWVAIWDALGWYTHELGSDISSITDGVSIAGMFGAIIGGSIWYLGNAFKNATDFINSKHIDVTVTNPDTDASKKAIEEMVKGLSGIFAKHEDEKESETIIPELGASCYYKVDTSTPDAFVRAVNGKGFNEGWGYQCVAGFKEFQYSLAGRIVSAGGAAKYYANDPARANVCALGFTWHQGTAGIKNGDWAIWNMGTNGHVAMYYNGQFFGQNQAAANPDKGNAFNLCNISMSGVVGYFRPNKYAVKGPESSQKPTEAPKSNNQPSAPKSDEIKAGDSVIVSGRGTATSNGTGAQTKQFTNQKMKVIMIANGRCACNQYNRGNVGNASAVTGWFVKEQLKKA